MSKPNYQTRTTFAQNMRAYKAPAEQLLEYVAHLEQELAVSTAKLNVLEKQVSLLQTMMDTFSRGRRPLLAGNDKSQLSE